MAKGMIGALAYPLVMLGYMATRTTAVGEFERVGAISEATSRRPESLNVRRSKLKKDVAKGLLIAVGDGRYYVDRAAVKRRDKRALVIWGGGGLVFTIGLILLLSIAK